MTEADRHYRSQRPKPSNPPDPEALRRWREQHFGPGGRLATPREAWRRLGVDMAEAERIAALAESRAGEDPDEYAKRLIDSTPSEDEDSRRARILDAMAPHTERAARRGR